MARIFENGIGSNKVTRRFLETTALTAAGLALLTPNSAQAQDHAWTNFDTQSGSISTDISIPNTTNITQHSQVYIGNSNNLDILSHQTVNIGQHNNTALFVARSTREGEDPTRILGTLRTRMLDGSGNFTESVGGDVMVFDRNGVIFGRDSVVDVNSIIASTGNVSNADILDGDGRYTFSDFGDGKIELQGSVTVAEAGLAGFVSPFVSNSGVINAKMGKVAMAGGDKVTLDLYGDSLVEIAVDDKAADALLENAGVINAEGGQVIMTAQAAKEITDNIINVSGVVNASSATVQGGKIILGGGAQGKVAVSGVLAASGKDGGDIEIKGKDIEVTQEALLLADGGAGENQTGNGGTIYTYADNDMAFSGRAMARGGAQGGDGGFVEVSATNRVGYDGAVSTKAYNGVSGTFLIDPLFAIIHSGSIHTPLGFDYILSAEALANDLAQNGSLLVQADEFIDVGTDIDLDIPLVGSVENGPIDLANYSYSEWAPLPPGCGFFCQIAFYLNPANQIHDSGITAGGITLQSNTVNFNKELTIGKGNLTVLADTINLGSTIKGYEADESTINLLDAGRMGSTASTVNVLSNAARIQQGVDIAATGATVSVAADTYNESITVAKSVSLKGANAGKDGTDPTRGAETVIDGVDEYPVYINADNVTLDGFTILGDDNAATTDYAVLAYNADNATIKNNIVKDAAFGIFAYGSGTPTDSLIANNFVTNIDSQAIHTRDNAYADILDNTITDTVVGITTENFWQAAADGLRANIMGNKVSAKSIGIRNNLSYGSQTGFNIESNTITAEDPLSARRWTGIDIVSQQAGVGTIFKDNDIDGSGAGSRLAVGYEGTNLTAGNTVIDGGDVKNVKYGVWATDGSFYTGAVNDLLIQNVAFSDIGEAAILAEDVYDAEDPLKSVNATGTTITIGAGNTYTNTPYQLALAGENLTVNDDAVMTTLVKAAGNSTFVGAPSGYAGGQWEVKNASINKGIGATQATGTVTVEDGTFIENVMIDKSLTLLSVNGRSHTTIEGIANAGANGTVSVLNGVNDVQVGDEDKGFTIVGFDNGNPGMEQAALYLIGAHSNVDILRNDIVANGDLGLLADYGFALSDINIDGNIFSGKSYVGATPATGNYWTTANVSRPLVFIGGPNKTGISFTNNDVTGDAGYNLLVSLEADGLDVSGNTFDGDSTFGALRVRGSNVTVADNGFTGNGLGFGILAENVNGLTIGGADDEDGNTVSGFKNGIEVAGGSNVTVRYNTTTDNTDNSAGRVASDYQTGIGIFMKGVGGIVDVLDNETTGNVDGIRIQDMDPATVGDVTVAGNTTNNNQDKGIILKRSDNIEVYNNVVNGNNIGIYADASNNPLIKANNINASITDGIRLRDGSSSADIENNWIHGSGGAGIYVDNSMANVTGVRVYDNSFAQNVTNASPSETNVKNIVNTSGNVVDASFNWWGSNVVANIVAKITNIANVDISPFQGLGVDQDVPQPGYQGSNTNLHVTNVGAGNGGRIQEAVDIAQEDGHVIVEAGEYTENLMLDFDGLKLEGLDGAVLKYDVANSGRGVAGNLITVDADDVNIDPFVFDGLGLAAHGINSDGADGTIVDGNTFQNFTSDAIRFTNSTNTLITGNTITNSTHGVYIGGGSDNTIEGGSISGTKWDSIRVVGGAQDTIIRDLAINNAGTIDGLNGIGGGISFVEADGATVNNVQITNAARMGIYAGGSNDIVLTNNTITNVGTGTNTSIGDSINKFSAIHAEGTNNLTVAGNEINGATGNGINLGGLINVPYSGGVSGTILVDDNTVENAVGGIYSINNAGTLAVTNNTIRDIGFNGISLISGGGYVNVSGNEIENTGWTGLMLQDQTGGGLVDDNDVNGTGALGIYILQTDGTTVSNNRVGNTGTVGGAWATGPGLATNAIHLERANNTTVSGNTVNGTNNGGKGIAVGGGAYLPAQATTGNVISGNLVFNTKGNGIDATDSADIEISGNVVGYETMGATTSAGANNIKGHGIHVGYSDGAEVSGNYVDNTRDNGINIDRGTGISVLDNFLNKIGKVGIRTDQVNTLEISGNVMDNVGWQGIELQGGSAATVDDNEIKKAGGKGISVSATNGVDVTNNDVKNTGEDGVYVNGAKNVEISGNLIHTIGLKGGAGWDGIDARNITNGLEISGNYVGYTTRTTGGVGSANNINGNGISVINSASAQVLNNRVAEATGNGIFVDPSDYSVITGNTISDVDQHGIYSLDNSYVRIGGPNNADRNYITNTQYNGIFVEGGVENIVQNNVINTTGDNGVIGNGIHIKDSADADVLGNRVGYRRTSGHNTTTVSNSIHGDGILVTGSDGTEIKGNFTNGTESEVNTSGNGIQVLDSDGVVIGGAGSSNRNTVNDAEWDGIRVAGGSDNVTVTNNRITNITHTGIYLGGVDTALVNLNDIDDAVDYGIHIDGGDHITVDDNDIDDIGLDGIYADTVVTSGLVIKNNDIGLNDGIGGNGIEVQSSHGAVITGNETNDTRENGIYVNASNDVEVGGTSDSLGNTITRAGANGIFVNGGSSALIQYNKVLGTNGGLSGWSLTDGTAGAQLDGIRVVGNDGVDILNNTIASGQGIEFLGFGASGGHGANEHGIAVYGSNGAVIDQNIVSGDLLGSGLGAGFDGIHVEDSHLLTVGGLVPVLNGNKVFSTGFDGISINGSIGALVLNNIIGGLPLMEVGEDGIDMDNTLGTIVAGNIITDVGDDGIEYTNGALSAIFLNFITNAGDDGIDMDAAALYLVAGNQITGSGSNGIELSNGLLGLLGWNTIDGSGEDGINVRTSALQLITGNTITDSTNDGIDAGLVAFTNISGNTVDGAGGDGIQTFLGLGVNVDGNTVRNVDGDGIFAHTVLGLNVTGNHVFTTGDDGIDVRNSWFANIDGNDTHDTDGDGIQVRDSWFANIIDNLVEDAGDDGIDVENSWFADVEQNHVHGADNNGIEVENSWFANIDRNHTSGTDDDGIYVRNSWFADIARNLVEWAFGDGIDVEGSAFADIERNRVRYVAGNGIEVSNSAFADIDRNRVRGVFGDGIHVDNSAFVDVTNNRVRGAFGDGIDVENSFAADIINNRIRYVGDNGIEVQNSHFTDIDNNNIRYAGDNGIYVNPSSFVDITNNRIRNVGDDGIDVNGGSFINIYNNFIRDAGDDGVDVNGSTNITIELNDIRRSGNVGIELTNVDVANLLFNTLTNNDDYGLWVRGGSNGSVILSGNTFTNNKTGSLIQSGQIDLTGATNTFTNGEYGMVFDRFGGTAPLSLVAGPTLMSFTNGTFGTTSFSGQSEAYIVFANNAFSNGFNNPVKLDATYVNFGGFVPNSKLRDANGIPILSQSEYDSIENMVFHFGDDLTLGQILFGIVPSPFDVDESKIFREMNFGALGLNGLNVRILGLPSIPGGPSAAAFNNITPFAGGGAVNPADLNNIETAAGGDGSAGGAQTAQQLNNIDTAAGGEEVGCWGDALNVASTGQAVNLNYGAGFDAVLSSAAGCGSNL